VASVKLLEPIWFAVDVKLQNEPTFSVGGACYTIGVLKDFFREMPEPLFTNGLYQMLLDAMTVQIADDPRGNAVIMLGVIDCLPTVHQVPCANSTYL